MPSSWYSENGKRAFNGTDYFLAGSYRTKLEAKTAQRKFNNRYFGSRVTAEEIPHEIPKPRYVLWIRTKHR
jgi:hypothetical protein